MANLGKLLEHDLRSYGSFSSLESSQSSSSTKSKEEKIQALSKSKFLDMAEGIRNSKIGKALLFTAVVVSVFLITSNPVGWMVGAAAVGSFAIGMLCQMATAKDRQKISFELSAIGRLLKPLFNKPNFQMIKDKQGNETGVILGCMPNRLSSDFSKLVLEHNIGAVLSVNEDFERVPRGMSIPASKDDWSDFDVIFIKLNSEDHKPLSVESLHKAADSIKEMRDQGRVVYVHCRAGVGRSAMSIAAYLIKYQVKTVDEAVEMIKTSRPISTVDRKKDRLEEFKNSLN